jgi:hypothetical protein
MSIYKADHCIRSLDEWEDLAGPVRGNQWREGRSAMEAARSWLEAPGGELPAEVAQVLLSSPHFGKVEAWDAEPEARLSFDSIRGNTRNTDLAVNVWDVSGHYFLAVEAKADESFCDTIAKKIEKARRTKGQKPRSKLVTRIENLTAAILSSDPYSQAVGKLRYQLLTACAGAVAEAERRGCQRAVVLVQEFITDETDGGKLKRNASDLNYFLELLLARAGQAGMLTGPLRGPFQLPGHPLFRPDHVQLYIGKATKDLRTP